MSTKLEILQKYWMFPSFRPLQEEIIDAVLAGDDVLALLPTGGGKSICFQVPALLMDGICLVVTPLIALMQDQVEQLNKRGIKAVAINSSMGKKEIDVKLDNCIYGDVKFLYVSPERLKTDIFRSRLVQMQVSLVAVDEAHCISQWGYDFRPAYLEIAEIRELIPAVNIVALTATATQKVQADIQDKLKFRRSKVFTKSFARENLSYSVRQVDDKYRKLLEVLKSVRGSTIVYSHTRKSTKELAAYLYKHEVSADYYHAGLSHVQRETRQQNWVAGQTRVMVATNAFGMGIDKPDVRLVVHMSLPQNLESYYQEAGRAGRDEKKAFALIIYNEADVEELEDRSKLQHPSLDLIKNVYQCLANNYKLAVGSGGDISYNFDLHEFSDHYNLNPLETYHAIKKLEEHNILQLNEGFYSPSKLNIPLDNESLYKFQIANAKFDPLIKAILRLYGGEVYTSFITISESQLASYLETNVKTIADSLIYLQKQGVVSYEPQKDKPQLLFVGQRHAVDTLPVNRKLLEERKKESFEKMHAIIDYVKDAVSCRTAQLLTYFGEKDFDQCGVCDVCIAKKKKQINAVLHTYHDQVFKAVTEKALSIEALIDQLNPSKKDEFLEVVRQMVDAGELKYDDQWRLKKP